MPLDATALHRRLSSLEIEGGGKPFTRRLHSYEGPRGHEGPRGPRRSSEPFVRALNPPVGNHPLRAHPVTQRKSEGTGSGELDDERSYHSALTTIKDR